MGTGQAVEENMSNQPIGFDDILAPHSRERFLSEYWTKKFLHQPGVKGRIASILGWD